MRLRPTSMSTELSASWRTFSGATVGVFLVFLGSLNSCTSPSPPEQPVKSAPREPGDVPGEEWVFHPTRRGEVTDRLSIGTQHLEVDNVGSRWLLSEDGTGRSSPFGAPEPLSAVGQIGSEFLCVGQSGTVYLAKEPLGPFVEVRSPPQLFSATKRVGERLVSLSKRGSLFLSVDLGQSWSQISATEFFVGLSATKEGQLLAYSVPERWHLSRDGGKRFDVLDTPPVAPLSFGRGEGGSPIVHGMLSDFVFLEGSFRRASPSKVASQKKRKNSSSELPRFAQASPIARGRARLREKTYSRLLPSKGSLPWRIERAELNDVLVSDRVKGLTDCGRFLFSINQATAVVVCMNAGVSESSPLLRIFTSRDGGRNFKREKGTFRGLLNDVVLDVSKGGEIALAGLCAEEEPQPGCRIRGVTTFSGPGSGAKRRFFPGVEKIEALSFGPRAELWVAGYREKDGSALVFSASMRGDRDLRIIDLSREAELALRPISAVERRKTLGVRSSGVGSRSGQLAILPGQSFLSVVLDDGVRDRVFGFDDEGQLVSVGQAPIPGAQVHGSGRKLVALSRDGSDFWQSTTAGVVWQQVELPRPLCTAGEELCPAALACSEGGCLVGDELTRTGYGEAGSPVGEGSVDSDQDEVSSSPLDGYHCSLGKDEWRPLPGIVGTPTASDAGLGSAAWAQVAAKHELSMAVALEAPIGQVKIVERELLPHVSNPEAHLLYVSEQIEGSAAVRTLFPPTSATSSASTVSTNVEVGWDNRIEGLIGGATVTVSLDAESTPSWVLTPPRRSRRPALISVAGDGLYLKMQRNDAGTFFLSGTFAHHRSEQVLDPTWPPMDKLSSGWLRQIEWRGEIREERLRLGGSHGSLLFVASGRAIVRPTNEVGVKFAPYLIAPLSDEAPEIVHGARIAYRGKSPGLLSIQLDLEQRRSSARFVELLPDGKYGTPEEVPLQSQLPEAVQSCGEEARRTTARVVAPAEEGLSRKVVVSGISSEMLELQTDSAVLFGTPTAPCVFAWDTLVEEGRSTMGQENYRVLLLPGPRSVSWIFRESGVAGQSSVVSARSLSCHSVPARASSSSGTLSGGK